MRFRAESRTGSKSVYGAVRFPANQIIIPFHSTEGDPERFTLSPQAEQGAVERIWGRDQTITEKEGQYRC